MSERWQRGQIAKCVEDGRDWSDYHVTIGREYVVNAVERHHGANYLKILGDDDQGYSLLHSMFKPMRKP